MLCSFQVYPKVLQLYIYIYSFSFRFFSYIGYYFSLKREQGSQRGKPWPKGSKKEGNVSF